MTLRCVIDGLLLPADVYRDGPVVAHDGDEAFGLEAVEAIYYEVVAATADELLEVTPRYRMLRIAPDFRKVA
ncbi:MAG: hypothetical protein U0746_18865 [Gemmataceae bacterium]